MNSGEFAKMAGVTVRTLRHYRNIGLLEGVNRKENGYYDYTVEDFVKVLRIKNMASLGFSLEKIAGIMAKKSHENSTQLDELDKDLKERIERLEQQRRTVAALKSAGVSADTPAGFVRVAELLVKSDCPDDMIKRELDSLLMIEHIFDGELVQKIMDYYEDLINSGCFEEYLQFDLELYRLKESASEEDKERIARKGAELFRKLAEKYSADAKESEAVISDEIEKLFQMYDGEEFYSLQNDISERIIKLLT